MIRTLMAATALATLASPAFAETIPVAPGEGAQGTKEPRMAAANPSRISEAVIRYQAIGSCPTVKLHALIAQSHPAAGEEEGEEEEQTDKIREPLTEVRE